MPTSTTLLLAAVKSSSANGDAAPTPPPPPPPPLAAGVATSPTRRVSLSSRFHARADPREELLNSIRKFSASGGSAVLRKVWFFKKIFWTATLPSKKKTDPQSIAFLVPDGLQDGVAATNHRRRTCFPVSTGPAPSPNSPAPLPPFIAVTHKIIAKKNKKKFAKKLLSKSTKAPS